MKNGSKVSGNNHPCRTFPTQTYHIASTQNHFPSLKTTLQHNARIYPSLLLSLLIARQNCAGIFCILITARVNAAALSARVFNDKWTIYATLRRWLFCCKRKWLSAAPVFRSFFIGLSNRNYRMSIVKWILVCPGEQNAPQSKSYKCINIWCRILDDVLVMLHDFSCLCFLFSSDVWLMPNFKTYAVAI